ncbi:MAG: prephenate dehydrogenase dimerization domain-containing protein, partial [Verrucomicrobiota bacterium]
AHTEADLFRGAKVILTPDSTGLSPGLNPVESETKQGQVEDSTLLGQSLNPVQSDLVDSSLGDERDPFADALETVDQFWRALGSETHCLDAATHDRLVARISHLPHLTAAALTRVALKPDPSLADFAGGGLRDTTRIASGPESMWAEILSDNHEAVRERLDALISELQSWREALDPLDTDQVRRFLCEARQLRKDAFD